MKFKLMQWSKWLLAVTILAAGMVALFGPVVTGEQLAQADSPPVFPPNGTPLGKSYGEWSAEWWQWAYSIPARKNHPLIADGEMDCSLGQEGDVWFLGGTFTSNPDPNDPRIVVGTADRVCTVPTGKALFFPIINAECNELNEDGANEQELRACANGLIDLVDPKDLSATIDGQEIRNLQVYRDDSPLFKWGPLPAKNLFGEPRYKGETSLSVADGYYLMVEPLTEGEHEVDFIGKVVITDPETDELIFSFTLDIKYDLTVVSGPKK